MPHSSQPLRVCICVKRGLLAAGLAMSVLHSQIIRVIAALVHTGKVGVSWRDSMEMAGETGITAWRNPEEGGSENGDKLMRRRG
mmetsp:Transcript_25017/g.64946  ORF Transcript_25017/g.64946 Transcript_25017/m.64946 type:complete len:84 (-) Transcript_25017:252-503(-)